MYSLAEVRGVVEVVAPEFVQQSRKNDVLLLLELFLAEFLNSLLPEVGGVLLPEVAGVGAVKQGGALLKGHCAVLFAYQRVFHELYALVEGIALGDALYALRFLQQSLVLDGTADALCGVVPPGYQRLQTAALHYLVVEGGEKPALADVALTAGSAAELLRYPRGFPHSRSYNEQSARLLDLRFRVAVRAAELDVYAAPRHVGGYRDRSRLSGAGDYVRFRFVVFRVQHSALDTEFAQFVG